MKTIDFETIEKKFPNRDWRGTARRIEAGEPVPTTMREVIERYTKDA